MEDLGLSAGAIAQMLSVESCTVERWLANQGAPENTVSDRLTELIELLNDMLDVLGSAEAARHWLRTSNTYLGGMTPEEVLETGHIDTARADLLGLAAGVYL